MREDAEHSRTGPDDAGQVRLHSSARWQRLHTVGNGEGEVTE